MNAFEAEYKKLNTQQKDAVETLHGPVMVVAGPGTGKTQVLALRIANILKKTDIKADGILCLTFTNSAVGAMKERLVRYIGEEGDKVNIFTFHSFGMKIIEEYYAVLGLPSVPKLLEDTDTALLFDEILNNNTWSHLRPRGDSMRYFSDLRSLISLLTRERITKEDFADAVEKDIRAIQQDESNISSRGSSKGELKQDAQKKIEGLERSREIVKFIELYEKTKKEKNVLDYDDVLESLVAIMETSEDAVASLRERYLYILVDEHQDSSRVQNEFLKKVWSEVENPDIFVVGDDRQLIYGFSGASIDHFQGFKKIFPGAKLIPLVDNYRSTQVILDAAHTLLRSVMSDEKLVSQSTEAHPIRLVETATPEDEIVRAGLDIKDHMKQGLHPSDCAILVPKNAQVRKALEILHELGLPVSTLQALSLFDQEAAIAFLRVLKIISNGDPSSLALSFFDRTSGIEPISAHTFIVGENMREFSLETIQKRSPTLFGGNSQVEKWIQKLTQWKKDSEAHDVKSIIEIIAKDLFANNTREKKLVGGEEILDTIVGLLAKEIEKNPKLTLSEFVAFLEKLKSFGGNIALVSLPKDGVKVLTMHSAKGLEFDYVWIAHMDERSLDSGKRAGFTLPEAIRGQIEERDVDAVKRKLYVAITRAKRFCTLSYSFTSQKGSEQKLARVIADLPSEIFEKPARNAFSIADTGGEKVKKSLCALQELVSKKYADRHVSASLLNNFFECPWKWYFRNVLQLPEPTNENLEFGVNVHAAIDTILRMDHTPSEKELGGLILDPEIRKVVSRWVQNRLPEIAGDHLNEQSVSLRDKRFPQLHMYGRIDLIEKISAKNLRVTDFKTGSVRKKNEIEKLDDEGRQSNHLRQLAMYSYLLENSDKWNEARVSESRLEFLEAKDMKKSIYDRVITKEDIELLIRDITDYDQLANSGEWVNRECNYNSYGKNTECEYCKRGKIYTEI